MECRKRDDEKGTGKVRIKQRIYSEKKDHVELNMVFFAAQGIQLSGIYPVFGNQLM